MLYLSLLPAVGFFSRSAHLTLAAQLDSAPSLLLLPINETFSHTLSQCAAGCQGFFAVLSQHKTYTIPIYVLVSCPSVADDSHAAELRHDSYMPLFSMILWIAQCLCTAEQVALGFTRSVQTEKLLKTLN